MATYPEDKRPITEAESPFEQPLSDVIRRAEYHTYTVQTWLPARLPGAELRQGRGCVMVRTSAEVPLFNQVLGADFHTLSAAEVRAEVEAVFAYFEGRRFNWWVGPNATPIGERLAARGLKPRGGLPSLAAPLPSPKADSPLNVWRAASLDDLRAASDIRRRAFGFPLGQGETYFEDAADSWLNPDLAAVYLARAADGQAASLATTVTARGLPGLYAMATLPHYERQGLGSAIVRRILYDAAGAPFITLTASAKGFGLYRRWGFRYLFDFEVWTPPA